MSRKNISFVGRMFFPWFPNQDVGWTSFSFFANLSIFCNVWHSCLCPFFQALRKQLVLQKARILHDEHIFFWAIGNCSLHSVHTKCKCRRAVKSRGVYSFIFLTRTATVGFLLGWLQYSGSRCTVNLFFFGFHAPIVPVQSLKNLPLSLVKLWIVTCEPEENCAMDRYWIPALPVSYWGRSLMITGKSPFARIFKRHGAPFSLLKRVCVWIF